MDLSPSLWGAFELSCLLIVAFALLMLSRRRNRAEFIRKYFMIAVAALLGESTCISFYKAYSYNPSWHLIVLSVPILVALIWPIVILSARDVVDALFPGVRMRPLWVGLLVIFDASFVEVIAVHAGLWRWADPGYFSVPPIGIVGWGCFAFAIELLEDRLPKRSLALIIPLAPLLTHILLVSLWWGGFKWVLQGPLPGTSTLGFLLISAAFSCAVLAARRRGNALDRDTAVPRIAAALLFFVVLAFLAQRQPWLWLHAALTAAPYLCATDLRRRPQKASVLVPTA